MKKIFLLGFLGLLLFVYGCGDDKNIEGVMTWEVVNSMEDGIAEKKEKIEKLEKEIEELKKDMEIEYDEFTKSTTIEFKETDSNWHIKLYIRKIDDSSTLKAIVLYVWDDRVFFNKVRFLISWEVYDYYPKDRIDEVLHWGKVFEWSEEVVDQDFENLINKIIETKSAKIRIQGETRYEDFTLQDKEIIALKKVYELYKKLEEKKNLSKEISWK